MQIQNHCDAFRIAGHLSSDEIERAKAEVEALLNEQSNQCQ